jgi:NDP-sugar pyrophosphorylase family protein
MLLLITAAGEGSRFRAAGITVPKPLIQVQGRTLLEHTLGSFTLAPGDQLLIAVQRAHAVTEQLGDRLKSAFPGVTLQWLELDALLPGQLATAVAALEQNLPAGDPPLLIHNCDTGFAWQSDLLPGAEAYGSMAVFPAEGEHWSFGRPDPQDPSRAIAIAEKQRISELASIGLYGFQSVRRFLGDARQQLRNGDTVKGEHYVAPLLQHALTQGETVQLPRVGGVRLYGTPAELCSSFQISLEQLRADNP